jgi:hypothetical protein
MNTREQTLFRATVAVVVLAVVYFLLINPALNRYEDLSDRQIKVDKKEKELRMLIRRRSNLSDEIHDLEERVTASAPETMESDFTAHLKEIAEKSKLTPTAESLVKRQPLRDDFEQIVLSVNLECDITELTDYLFHLEKTSDRLVRISRLDVSRGSRRRSTEAALSVNMVLSTVIKSAPEGKKTQGGKNEEQ